MTLKTVRDPTLPPIPLEEEKDDFDRTTRFRKGQLATLKELQESVYDDLSKLDPRVKKGIDTTDDLIVDLATKGLVLKDTQAPDPHYWRVTVENDGTLTTTDLGIGKP